MNFNPGWIVLLLLTIGCQSNQEKIDQWAPILNDNDLNGWTPKIGGQPLNEDSTGVFKIEKGVLKVYDHKENRRTPIGHLFYQKPVSNFRLKFEYRFTGNQFKPDESWPEQYGGIVFHAQSPESMGLLQEYPICLEFQLLGGKNTGERPTGNVCTIGTQVFVADTLNPAHCIESSSITYDGNSWISAEIEVWSDSLIRHYINDEMVLEYTRPIIGGGFVSENFNWEKGNVRDWEYWATKEGTPLKSGFIAIQAHDPMEFRNIVLYEVE